MSWPCDIKPEVKPEDFTPAGELNEVKNTLLRIYKPCWIKDQNDQDTLKLWSLRQNCESISGNKTWIFVACAVALSNRKVSETDEKTQYLSKAEKRKYQNVFLKKMFLGIEHSKSLEDPK